MEQNYKNHRRIIPSYHFITLLSLIAMVIGSFVNLFTSTKSNLYSASLICLGSLIMLSLFFHCRRFAVRAQDRAIRAEENLRHFIITGKPLDRRLQMRQVIALRFAPDEEFIELAKKAADQNLSSLDIKLAIKNWKADYNRA